MKRVYDVVVVGGGPAGLAAACSAKQAGAEDVLAIEVDGTGFHEAGSKQAERDMKKNSILEKCGVPLLRLRTDGSGEKEKIKNALKRD